MNDENYVKRTVLRFLLVVSLLLIFPTVAMAQIHTVSRGESLFKISQWYGVDQFALRYANNQWNDSIYPGQRLNIPVKYTVQRGDTPYLIGNKFGVNYVDIQKVNQLGNSHIYPGQVLYIPQTQIQQNSTPSAPATANRTVSRGNFSRSDFDLLARIITAEADSESYETQVAVGAVILNRIDSRHFPNTIPGVVYQVNPDGRYQFEPVLNGWINRPASATARRAAEDAVNGWDPSNGAIYFFESWVTNKFLQARPLSRIMDAFTFTY